MRKFLLILFLANQALAVPTAYSCKWENYDLIFSTDVIDGKTRKTFEEDEILMTLNITNITENTASASIWITNTQTKKEGFKTITCRYTQ